jgi:hypothetical protein
MYFWIKVKGKKASNQVTHQTERSGHAPFIVFHVIGMILCILISTVVNCGSHMYTVEQEELNYLNKTGAIAMVEVNIFGAGC